MPGKYQIGLKPLIASTLDPGMFRSQGFVLYSMCKRLCCVQVYIAIQIAAKQVLQTSCGTACARLGIVPEASIDIAFHDFAGRQL